MRKLSPEDQAVVDNLDREFGRYLETIKRAQQFNLNDFLVLNISNYGHKMTRQTNSYGAPIKYKVVFVNEQGIPFVKRVNKNGDPIGPLSSCIGMAGDEYYRDERTVFTFELDPDYADAIILQDEYDPTSLHRSKKEIWKAVTEHNKAHKVPAQHIKDLIEFFDTVQSGDTLWTSNVTSYFVENRESLSPKEFNKTVRYNQRTYVVASSITVLSLRDKNGKVKRVAPDFFHHKALYKVRPRSYKELNI